MIKLLILADDITGALDSGVQCADAGVRTIVTTDRAYAFDAADAPTVLVMDTESRHLTAEAAYRVVSDAVRRAAAYGVQYFYKKTDSALRGNIGSELSALLNASGEDRVAFVPAYPQMGRVVRNGVLWIDRVPVAKSSFGSDPRNPVLSSDVAEVLRMQTGTPVRRVSAGALRKSKHAPDFSGIEVFDAECVPELTEIAAYLKANRQLRLLAGCAGFAACLPALLQLKGERTASVPPIRQLLVLNGSVHPTTGEQLDVAEARGFIRIRLSVREKLDVNVWHTAAGEVRLRKMRGVLRSGRSLIVDSADKGPGDATLSYAAARGIAREELQRRIPLVLGGLLKVLLEESCEGARRSEDEEAPRERDDALPTDDAVTVMMIGGDTLYGCMEQLGVREMTPVCEAAPGTVFARIRCAGRQRNILTKSGGFGTRQLLAELTGDAPQASAGKDAQREKTHTDQE